MKTMTRILLVLLALLLAFSLFACNKNEDNPPVEEPNVTNNESNNETTSEEPGEEPGEQTPAVNEISKTGVWADAIHTTDKTFGEGSKTILVEVKAEEQSLTFTINTDEETLADALLAHEIVEGEDGPFGLYVKKVNGITADYDIDQTYWSLSKGGQMLMVGASDTVIANGDTAQYYAYAKDNQDIAGLVCIKGFLQLFVVESAGSDDGVNNAVL